MTRGISGPFQRNDKTSRSSDSSNENVPTDIRDFFNKINAPGAEFGLEELRGHINNLKKNNQNSKVGFFTKNCLNLINDYIEHCRRTDNPDTANNEDLNIIFKKVVERPFMRIQRDGQWIIDRLIDVCKDASVPTTQDLDACYRSFGAIEKLKKSVKKVIDKNNLKGVMAYMFVQNRSANTKVSRPSSSKSASSAAKLNAASVNSLSSSDSYIDFDNCSIHSNEGQEDKGSQKVISNLDLIPNKSSGGGSFRREGSNDWLPSRSSINLVGSPPDHKPTGIPPDIFPGKLADLLEYRNKNSSTGLPPTSPSMVPPNTKGNDVLENNIGVEKSKPSINNITVFPDLLKPTIFEDSINQDTIKEDVIKREQKLPSKPEPTFGQGINHPYALGAIQATENESAEASTKDRVYSNVTEPDLDEAGDNISISWGVAPQDNEANVGLEKNKVLNQKQKTIGTNFEFIKTDIENKLSTHKYSDININHSLKGLVENLKCRIEEAKNIKYLNSNASETDRNFRHLQLLTLRASENLAREIYRRILHEDYEPTEKTKNFFAGESNTKPLTLDILLDQTEALPKASEMRVRTRGQKIEDFDQESKNQLTIASNLRLIYDKEKSIREGLTNEINSIYIVIESKKKLVADLKNKLDEVEDGPAMGELNLIMRFGSGFVLNILNKNPEIRKNFTTSIIRLNVQQENLKVLIDKIGSIELKSNNESEELDLQDLIKKKNELIKSLDSINEDYKKLESENNNIKELFEQSISKSDRIAI